jgi:hypothetical protein
MASKKIVSALLIVGVLAASASTAALADDHRNHDRGNGVAVAAGILGAVVIGSLIANSQPVYAAPQQYYQPEPYYQPEQQQVYYQPQAQYYGPQAVAYVDGGYRERHEYRRYHRYHRDHDGYYAR